MISFRRGQLLTQWTKHVTLFCPNRLFPSPVCDLLYCPAPLRQWCRDRATAASSPSRRSFGVRQPIGVKACRWWRHSSQLACHPAIAVGVQNNFSVSTAAPKLHYTYTHTHTDTLFHFQDTIWLYNVTMCFQWINEHVYMNYKLWSYEQAVAASQPSHNPPYRLTLWSNRSWLILVERPARLVPAVIPTLIQQQLLLKTKQNEKMHS